MKLWNQLYVYCRSEWTCYFNCIKHDFAKILIDKDPQKNEFIWNKLWWASHYGGRGGSF